MKSFSELNIKQSDSMMGDKIKISNILGHEIVVHAAKIEESKYPKGKFNKCLYLQISMDGQDHVVFTASSVLINAITQIQEDDYPFLTKIIKSGECFKFV